MTLVEYGYFACVLVILAIVVNVAIKFDADAWLTKDLKRGDLYALIDVASRLRPDGLTHDQARRLQARGLVRPYGDGQFRVTFKGRLALRLRQAVRQTA